ncbi:hypothetical protein J6590_106642, partial [Homalodisca vitripennis]
MTVSDFLSDLITSITSVEESEVKRATVICLSQEEIRGKPFARNREPGSVLPPTSINSHDSRKYVGDLLPAIENVALFFPQPQSILMTVSEFQSDLITSNTSVEESE